MELLACDSAQHVVLIEPLKKRRQFRVSAPHSIELFLHGVDFPPKFYAVLLVDALGEQPLLLPCEVRYPAQIAKYYFD